MSEASVRLAYYGDDFTGSTDVLEALALAGVDTILFLKEPTPAEIAEYDSVDAIGIAGTSRRMTPNEMDEDLPEAFETLAGFRPDILQYKVCSTFDSAPSVGSIGHAIDIAQATIGSPFVPIVVAVPSLEPRGRYVVFGNLFASVGGRTYRIDRHPTMRDHPVTPMTEADLSRHLADQTDRSIGKLPVQALNAEIDAARTALERTIEDHEIVLFDGMTPDHQRRVGELVWEARPSDGPLVSAASSGLNYALTAYWETEGIIESTPPPDALSPVDQLVVVSGSASPVTRDQIEWALTNGFTGIRLDTAALIDPATAAEARTEAISTAMAQLDAGESVILYSARGPDDPAIDQTRQRAAARDIPADEIDRRLGEEQGRILRTLLEETRLDRVCVAGGDTSGHVAPALDIYALEFLVPVGPGSPLCRGRSHTAAFDGLQIALKGGQVQTEHSADDFFGVVRDGGVAPES